MTRYMQVKHKATGKTASARKHVNGLVWVQFDDLNHPQAYGWHLYRHKDFVRMRKK